MLTTFERLYTHLTWADNAALESLRSAPEVDAGTLRLFAHVLDAERAWLRRIEGKDGPSTWPGLTLEECTELARELRDGFGKRIAALDDAELARLVRYKNSQGTEFETSVQDILLHVALHGAHHRGQIAARLRAHGSTPAITDYIALVRAGGLAG